MSLARSAAAARRRTTGGAIRIAADEIPNRRVFQRVGGSVAITLSGTVTGDASAVAARVIRSDTSAEVVAWTTVSSGPGVAPLSDFSNEFSSEFMPVAPVSSNAWVGTITVPQGGWYKIQYRLTSEPTSVYTANNLCAVGDIWMFAGESQQARLSTVVNVAPTPDNLTVYFNAGGTWDLPGAVAGTGGNGMIRFLNLMRSATSVPQACIQVSVEGTSILDWEQTDPAYITAASRLSAVGNIAGILWHQGGTDIGTVSRTDYKARLAAVRSAFQATATFQRFAVFPLMHRLAAANTDANTHDIRRAHFEHISENAGTINLGWVPDVPLSDDVNQSAAGSETLAYAYAHALLFAMGTETVNNLGPAITSATRSGTAVTLAVQHKSGTSLKINSGTVATGFQVFPRGATHSDAAALAISGVSLGTNAITLTLATNPNTAVDVYYDYGRFDNTAPVFDNTSALGRTTGNALLPLLAPVQTAVETGQLANPVLNFDGETGVITYPDNAAWDLPDSDWTIGVFAKLNSNAGTVAQYLYSTGFISALQTYNFFVLESGWSTPDRFEFNVRGAGASAVIAQGVAASTVVTNNEWRFWIVERIKTTETLNLYYLNLNGTRTLYRTVSSSGLGAVQPIVAPTFGTRASSGETRYLNGALHSFFKLNGVLSDAEMAALARGEDIINDLRRAPGIYIRFNSLTNSLPNTGNGGAMTGTISGNINLAEGPVFTSPSLNQFTTEFTSHFTSPP